jgi:ERCC4-related helicase
LEKETFETIFIPIKPKEAKTFMKLHENFLKTSMVEVDESLKDLRQEMDNALEKLGDVFVKSSSRSPKDVRNDELLAERLNKAMENRPKDDNTKLWKLLQVATELFKLNSSNQIFDLFIRSNRVYEDFSECFQLLSEEKFNVRIPHFTIRFL